MQGVPLFLVAGPGSGKTRVLLWRTVNLIVFRGVAPERIFLGTFTEKAAKQLRDGLTSLLGVVTQQTGRTFDTSRMYVGTVHSLCNRMLTDRAFSPGRARSDAPVVLDALDQYFELAAAAFWREARATLGFVGEAEALRQAVNAHFEDSPTPSRHKAVSNLVSLFNRLSEENLQPSDLLKVVGANEKPLFVLYELYRRRLDGRRVDLSLLQQAALKLLTLNERDAGVFDHVIVDEYQDTNAIQERIFLTLSRRTTNLCVVGDDDQALYRFRGATVENFVDFPDRCREHLATEARRIELSTNYRSRRGIVDFVGRFIEQTDWRRPNGGYYRLHDKGIHAHSTDAGTAVVASTPGPPEDVASEIAGLVRRLVDTGRVADPNQIAFLFPSLKSVAVERLERALGAVGLRVYAPRAKRFLEADEPTALIGLVGLVLGRPPRNEDFDRGGYREFHNWLDACATEATQLVRFDRRLLRFVRDRQAELAVIRKDFATLTQVLEREHWDRESPYQPGTQKRALLSAPGLSPGGKRALAAAYLDRRAEERLRRGDPFPLRYVISRATSVDWGLLDLFYRLVGFDHFKAMFDLAEMGADEGPICNLALTSQYLARYIDQFPSVITAGAFEGDRLQNGFYHAFLFALFRLGEGEFEDAEDPFPKGRIPFLTIHQSKGLEFPVVVLGNLYPVKRAVRAVETLVRPLVSREGEPLDRMGDFDAMRMFYVALSRAKNLLVLPHVKGAGQQIDPGFRDLLRGNVDRIPSLELDTVPPAAEERTELARRYSYTGDYLAFLRCPRQYMLFHKYGFAGSRTQTMFFGSLVHQTIEDLHNHLIATRQATGAT
jgi:DNA helicase-2/ATP-dependent DNA helicase PcrA